MDEEEVVEELKARLGTAILEVKVPQKRRVFITVDRAHYRAALEVLWEAGFDHLIAITGVDAGDHFEVIAHVGRELVVSVKAIIPRSDASIPSLIDLYKGAEFYERETWEMLGIVFEGNPRLSRTFLPESWPENVYPLRKDYESSDTK